MDINGDGHQDIITGHYWPGDIFVLYGEGHGKFGKLENLKDETGRNLNAGEPWEDEKKYRMESLAAAPYAADFDGDGDYDMLIGNIEGAIVLMENIGGAKKPVFSTKRKKLEAAGEAIRVPHGDAGPVFEDWNHDKVRDLVIGAGDGSVWFYENTGQNDSPRFASGKKLIGESKWDAFPHGGMPTKAGVRTKVCVTDYNGDGLVDLLVGDYISEQAASLELTDAQIKRREELRAKQQELLEQLNKTNTSNGKEPDQDKARNDILTKYRENYTELSQLEPREISHGFVWLYLRRPAQTASAKK